MNGLSAIFTEDICRELDSSGNGVSGIRLKIGAPAIFTGYPEKIPFPTEKICSDIIKKIILKATENSLYAYINDIREGFITIRGGHRMGICGRGVYEENSLVNIKDISSLHIRIAREIKGVSDNILKEIYTGEILNTLIISPAGGGKTTYLRDIARNLGNIPGMRPAIIDSRYEIGAEYRGMAELDIGMRSFLLSGYTKKDGFSHGIRCLSANVIICDELGDESDAVLISDAARCGTAVIASVHGRDINDLYVRKGFGNLVSGLFQRIIILKDRRAVNILSL